MENVLAKNLKFTGPFYKYDTARDYIQSLMENPPVDVSYDLLQEYEDKNSCCLVYQYRKPGVDETMAQLFEVEGNRITKIRLMFDASKFLDKKN